MPKAEFICPKCREKLRITFKAGEKPAPPKCIKCDAVMSRKYSGISLGDVVSDDMIEIGQRMLYS